MGKIRTNQEIMETFEEMIKNPEFVKKEDIKLLSEWSFSSRGVKVKAYQGQLKRAITEIHVFFEEIPLDEFQSGISRLPDDGINFINSLMFILESEQIKTRYTSVKLVLLFIAVETLMANSKFIDFNAWLVTNKEYLGNRDALLENGFRCKKLLNRYYEIN